jgi:hypothetical protein
MKFYKAVRIQDNKKVSLVVGKTEDSYQENLDAYEIEYKPNEWIHPVSGTGGIYIFSDLDSAIYRAKIEAGCFEIWECEVVDPIEFKCFAGSFDLETFVNFWNTYERSKVENKPLTFLLNYNFCHAPPNTYLAALIRLTKLVAERTDWDEEVEYIA